MFKSAATGISLVRPIPYTRGRPTGRNPELGPIRPETAHTPRIPEPGRTIGGFRPTMEDSTRSTLLQRLKDRSDTDAWATFQSLYRPLIVSYAISRGLSVTDADDVAQQCTQAVLEGIGGYQHLQSFKAWLRAIAEHKIVDQFRRAHGELHKDSAFWRSQRDVSIGADADALGAAWDHAWTVAHVTHCAERVRESVNESTFEAFAACVVRGMPPETVAGLLNISVNQVYVAKHRVLQRIREMLRELHGEDGAM